MSVWVIGAPSVEILLRTSKATCAMPAIRVIGAPIIEVLRCGASDCAVAVRVKSTPS
jgi:hypothetical protein